jgi:uncharacterized protein (TIGR02145 family)
MKRNVFLMLTLLMLSTASVNAQVRIGGDADPNPSAVLDLNATNTVNNGTLGLALPRVELTSTSDIGTITTPATGLTVYNTASAGSGATAVAPGVYIFNGNSWTRSSAGIAPVIITQPKAFSWSRLKDTNGDPNGPATATVTVLSVTATGSGTLTYQWYQKSANRNAPDSKLTDNGATTATYTPVVTAWGMKSYYCVVKNGTDSVVSAIADVAIGCGAKTADGGWLKFMCHNLGASFVGTNQSLDAITFTSDGSNDARGWLFQWGRAADGHQHRESDTHPGPVTGVAQTPPTTDGANVKFVTNSTAPYDWCTPQYDYFWRNWPDGRFPCPSGWKVPSASDWGALYRSGTTYGAPGQATANTWYWENNGYALRPDGTTTTLFLPAAGVRDVGGTLHPVGARGHYWSSTTASSGAFVLDFHGGEVSPESSNARANGFSVRCVSE